MTGLVLVSPKNQFFDSAGAPLTGGTVTTYLAGTTTLATTYQDRGLTTENTNPITLNARGECSIWGSISSTYKYVVKDSTGATIYTEDNIPGAGNASDIAAAVATALNDIADAQADADAALALAGSYIAQTGEAVLDALIDDETSAIAISAEADPAYAMKVVDAANVLNNDVGGVLDILASTVFGVPKMVMDTDRRTVVWSPHNFCKQTNALSNNVTGGTALDDQVDSDGTTDACKLTATSAVISAFSHANASNVLYQGMYHMQEWIVKAGTSTLCYIAWNEGAGVYVHAYFNLSTVALGTVDAGVTATISTTRADGTALPTGYYRITAYYASAAGNFDAMCGQCDADNSKAVTIGRTFFAEKAFLHLGAQAMEYFENTTTGHKIGVPYDYSKGGARILMEPAVTYNSTYADDLTNAAWTKTNTGAAKTTTGPHAEPCSTLTATAGNGTCIQAIVAAGASQNFSVFVRRRTGTGTISITSNNGVVWTDITSLLNSTTYTRVQVAGTTNPSIGFKITTNADAIDVALALNAPVSYMSSPRPVYAAATARSADPFIVPTSLMTAGTAYTVYADFDRITGAGFPDETCLRIGNTAMTEEMYLGVTSADGTAAMRVAKTGTSSYPIWTLSSGERLEITAKVEANAHVMSINGEPPAWNTTKGMPTMNQVRMAFSSPVFLRRLLVVNRAVDRDDVRTWRYSGAVRNNTLASQVVAYDSDAAVANATMNREPAMCVLSDDGATADVAVFWMQKHDTGHTGESPARLMQRNYRFDKTAGTVTALTTAAVIQQQAGWVLGEGHVQSPVAFTIPTGANAGRIVLLFTALELPDFTPDQRSIYVMTNDAGGDPTQWSTSTEIVSTASGAYAILDSSGSSVILPPSHATAPNRLLTNYYVTAGMMPLYSDNFGATWTSGTLLATARVPNESNMALLPDGSIVATHRISNGTLTERTWSKSTDGGVTFVDQGLLPAYDYAECSAGLAQLDPTGVTGAYGKTAISHPINIPSRLGMQIDIATDAAMTFAELVTPWAVNRYFGYSAIRSLFGGSHIALAVEGGSIPFNTDNSIFVAFIEAT
jgi:hypothetical protein